MRWVILGGGLLVPVLLLGCGSGEEPPSPPPSKASTPMPSKPASPQEFPKPAAAHVSSTPQEREDQIRTSLGNSDSEVRKKTALSLGDRSEDASWAIPLLIERMHDPDEAVRGAAETSLAKFAPGSVPALTTLLGHPNFKLRERAASALAKTGEKAAPAIPALVEVLGQDQASVSHAALEALLSIGEPAVEPLMRVLSAPSSTPAARRGAAEILGKLGAVAASALPALETQRGDRDPGVREAALRSVRQIRARTRPLGELVAELKESDLARRREASETLAEAGPELGEWVPALLEALRDKRNNYAVLPGLERALGRAGRVAVAPLLSLLDNADVALSARAVGPLKKIEVPSEEIVPLLLGRLKTSNAGARSGALQVLESLGARAKDSVPAIRPLLKDSEARIRAAAASLLGAIGPEASSAVQDLSGALQDSDASVRFLSAQALGKIGPAARDAEGALKEALKGGDGALRQAAEDSLRAIRTPK